MSSDEKKQEATPEHIIQKLSESHGDYGNVLVSHDEKITDHDRLIHQIVRQIVSFAFSFVWLLLIVGLAALVEWRVVVHTRAIKDDLNAARVTRKRIDAAVERGELERARILTMLLENQRVLNELNQRAK